MALIKADRPFRVTPCADEDPASGHALKMRQQRAPDASTLITRRDVRMTNQLDVAHPLNTHHSDQPIIHLISPELHTGRYFVLELPRRHVRLVPAIIGYLSPISLRRRVHDLQDSGVVLGATRADWANTNSHFTRMDNA